MDEKEVSEMQEEMMTVLVVEPMKAPYVKSIPNELEDLQQAVGGDIEMTYPFEDEVGILLNGNGKFDNHWNSVGYSRCSSTLHMEGKEERYKMYWMPICRSLFFEWMRKGKRELFWCLLLSLEGVEWAKPLMN